MAFRGHAAGRVVYRAELDVVARHTEPNPEPQRAFDCVETVRQTVLLVPGDDYKGPTRPPMVKEVETLCTYERLPNGVAACADTSACAQCRGGERLRLDQLDRLSHIVERTVERCAIGIVVYRLS